MGNWDFNNLDTGGNAAGKLEDPIGFRIFNAASFVSSAN